ncbi:transposase [Fundidesulfovibrio putealis]|uniref:transposase n=1 Tax=Fundidesulfovibrio putealis TaxID=270496 RepID=UPI00040F256F|nr:transposase [Fundidesulfovibrio putealis]
MNHQLERGGVLVREGAIVDASVVSLARRPTKTLDLLPQDRKKSEGEPDVTVTYSDDADAAWLRKGNKAYYGYKMHVATDSRDGFVLGGHVTPANHSDVKELPRLLQDVPLPPGGVVFADKGYSSQANREQLVRNGFCDGIMSKAHLGLPLSRVERRVNLLISSVRAKVERAFGTFKRNYYHLFRARYLGQDKVALELHLVAMAFNLKKCWAMVK